MTHSLKIIQGPFREPKALRDATRITGNLPTAMTGVRSTFFSLFETLLFPERIAHLLHCRVRKFEGSLFTTHGVPEVFVSPLKIWNANYSGTRA